MRKQYVLLTILFICACRTPAQAREPQKMSDQKPASNELLLKKIVGGFEGEKKEQGQFFECKVMSSDVKDVAQIKAWIGLVPRKVMTSFHFVARIPSLQILAYEGTTEIVLYKDYQTMEQPDQPSEEATKAIEELIKLADKLCPTPAKK
jgi:hypothetical protein